MPLSDSLGRPLRDLRISVTDRCNFRCRYCMPREHFGSEHQFLGKEEILSYEEISKLAKSMIPLGLKKLRITGGEPLIRRDIGHLVSMLHRLGDDLDLAMTTNGVLLKKSIQHPGLQALCQCIAQLLFHILPDIGCKSVQVAINIKLLEEFFVKLRQGTFLDRVCSHFKAHFGAS